MYDIFNRDRTGWMFLLNLHDAYFKEQVLNSASILLFKSRYDPGLHNLPAGMPVRAVAEHIVFAAPDRFQLQGPSIRPPARRLVNVQPLSRAHSALSTAYGLRPVPPNEPMRMLNAIEHFVADKIDLEFGRSDRLFWLAEIAEVLDIDLDQLLDQRFSTSTEAADALKRLLLHLGLPVYADTFYLVTVFSVDAWGAMPGDNTYRRPTAFDGVDNDYFKQRWLAHYATLEEWNKTSDLNKLADDLPDVEDGAWEIVGRPCIVSRVSAMVAARSGPDEVPACCDTFAKKLIDKYEAGGAPSWRSAAKDLQGVT